MRLRRACRGGSCPAPGRVEVSIQGDGMVPPAPYCLARDGLGVQDEPPHGTLLRDDPVLAVGGAGEKRLAGRREGAGAKGAGGVVSGEGVGVGWSRGWEEPTQT